ncbi:MAG: hypothetical protein AVDCRST_MAG39-1683 [uncultured Sphingomonadaceae bacterium]|uniref:Response regulatory domain-containing protein n=1 Tax=uncultured Sphingomonadaceae bacterium TaxID=169976 RepID=A0A6J4SVB9_9SPHN|nr:MAG: hypothetical protein AVDCRST_MAG39-1683 [uncultured Sphingomonadaceae bacterium]
MIFGKRERRIRRVLIVEDEALVAFDNENLLAHEGYQVVATVDNAADALAVIAVGRLDLVLADLALSGDGDGRDVARAAAAKGVPLLFLSGSRPDGAEGLGVGWLAKPYNPRQLKSAIAAVERLLGGERAPRAPGGLQLFAPAAKPVQDGESR